MKLTEKNNEIKLLWNNDCLFPSINFLDDFNNDSILDILTIDYIEAQSEKSDSLLNNLMNRQPKLFSKLKKLKEQIKILSNRNYLEIPPYFLQARLFTLVGDKFIPMNSDIDQFKHQWIGFLAKPYDYSFQSPIVFQIYP